MLLGYATAHEAEVLRFKMDQCCECETLDAALVSAAQRRGAAYRKVVPSLEADHK
jgi:hypothetical protein